MTTPTPRTVVERFIEEMWNNRRLDVADELFAPDCVTHQLRSAPGPTPAAPRGPAEIKREIGEWVAAFPDLRVEVTMQAAAGDLVTTHCAFRGTHRGVWYGIPPTGRAVTVALAVTHRVRDGRIAEDWVVGEWLGALEQLGIVSPLPELLARAAAERST